MSASETTIWTARTSLPTKVSADFSDRPARLESIATTIRCARICGWPPIKRSRPRRKFFQEAGIYVAPGEGAEHPRFFPGAADGYRRTAAEPGLDHAQLGAGGQDGFRGAEAVPELYSSRVTYRLIYTTTYLVNTRRHEDPRQPQPGSDRGQPRNRIGRRHERSTISTPRTATVPAELPAADAVRKELEKAGEQLVALRVSPPAADYDGPVLFEAPAAGSLLAQMLGPSLSGARGPLACNRPSSK